MAVPFNGAPFTPPPLWEAVPYQREQEPRQHSINCFKDSDLDHTLRRAYACAEPYFHNGVSYFVELMIQHSHCTQYDLVEGVACARPTPPDMLVSTQAPPPPPTLSDYGVVLGAEKIAPTVDRVMLTREQVQEVMGDAPLLELQVGRPLRKITLRSTPTIVEDPPLARPGPVVRVLMQILDDKMMDIVDLLPGEPRACAVPSAFEMVETRAQQAAQRALQQPQHQRAGLLGLASHYDW